MDKFSYINIREYLIQDNPNGIGEADLQEAVSDFSCPKNPDVEHFLKDNAIEFTKKNQSVTYLVMSNEDGMIVGYFTIALKPITVNANRMSNTVKRKLQRISKLDEATGTYTAAAFLIAQLGKNFTNQLNKRISGEELLDMGLDVPQITGIFMKLRKHGYDVDTSVYSPVGARKEILRYMKRND